MSERYDLVCSDFDSARAERLRATLRQEVGDVSLFEHALADETNVAMIDLEPTSANPAPSRNRRWAAQVILVAAAAVAVVAIAVVATRVDDATPADQPSPTVTVPPTLPPRALSDAQGELEPGTYFVDEVSGTPTPRIFFTIGSGWHGSSMGLVVSFDNGLTGFGPMTFDRPVAVFSDACHPSDGYHPATVTTLDGLVTALTEQQGWAAVTEPLDISIDGYAGKAFQRTAPATMLDCDRMNRFPVGGGNNQHDADFRSWENPDGQGGPQAVYQLNTVETLWVVDIDGTVVVISTRLELRPTTQTGTANAEFATVLDSIRIERA